MDHRPSEEQDLESPVQPKIDQQASKRRKEVQKHVVRVRIEAMGKQKSHGPPSDSWSWRKYGQKLIKGSPYPRGYYKCSTSKGCSARKQVERCKTDASVLIITYTSNHNHPGPDLPSTNTIYTKSTLNDITSGPGLSSEITSLQGSQERSQQSTMKEEPVNDAEDHLHILLDERGPSPCPDMMNSPSTAPKPPEENENDFFDELEELPFLLL